jgi:elongation of very long chain fatty acids protein 6
MPFLFHLLLNRGYEQTMCLDPSATWGYGPTGFWMMLFMYSKIPELIDTVFIILRKKPLLFLHWYHHATVLTYCWCAYSLRTGSGIFFATMNYGVHGLMYAYYCAQALGGVPKWFPTILITYLQIFQMLVGVAICLSGWYYYLHDIPCSNDLRMLIAAGVMYASYLFLFVQFFFNRYLGKEKNKSKNRKEQ